MAEYTLYTYFRSSAAFRARIALGLKGLTYTPAYVHLVKGGGEQHTEAYRKLNPQELIPSLGIDGEALLTQSLAIVEYLEELHPEPPLLPADPVLRAHVRAFALAIACEIHPLNNLRARTYLAESLHLDEPARDAWTEHWIRLGFGALETRLADHAREFCFGSAPTIADIFLVPQVYNAMRAGIDLDEYAAIRRVYAHCLTQDAFRMALPESQPDAE